MGASARERLIKAFQRCGFTVAQTNTLFEDDGVWRPMLQDQVDEFLEDLAYWCLHRHHVMGDPLSSDLILDGLNLAGDILRHGVDRTAIQAIVPWVGDRTSPRYPSRAARSRPIQPQAPPVARPPVLFPGTTYKTSSSSSSSSRQASSSSPAIYIWLQSP